MVDITKIMGENKSYTAKWIYGQTLDHHGGNGLITFGFNALSYCNFALKVLLMSCSCNIIAAKPLSLYMHRWMFTCICKKEAERERNLGILMIMMTQKIQNWVASLYNSLPAVCNMFMTDQQLLSCWSEVLSQSLCMLSRVNCSTKLGYTFHVVYEVRIPW